MGIPKKQKVAIAAIVLIGAVLSGVVFKSHAPDSSSEAKAGAKPAGGDASKEKLPLPTVATGDKDEKPADKDEKTSKEGNEKTAEKTEKTVALKQVSLPADEIRAAGIAVETVGPGKVGAVLQLPGEIQFNQDKTAHVVPRVAGTVQKVLANLGQQVKKGEILAIIASSSVSDQRSDLLTAQRKQEFATATYTREKKLWEEKISAEQDYLQAKQAMDESRLAVANAKQKLATIGASAAGTQLSQFEIRAPFDGVVVEKHIVLGDAVKDDTVVFTLSDLKTVWADVVLSPSNLNTVRVGTQVTVRASGVDTPATGTVAYVGSFLGEQSRTGHARVVLANPASIWRPGLYVTVEASNGEVSVPLTVDSEAIQDVDGAPTVFKAVDGGFLPQQVKLGRSARGTTEILEGLNAGDKYAAKGSFVLKADLGKANVKSDD